MIDEKNDLDKFNLNLDSTSNLNLEAYDLIIIGSGPGGYVGAIRAAQLGLKVAVVEKDNSLGGTCLNVGCIPSKALLESSENLEFAIHKMKKHGVLLEKILLDLPTMMNRKQKIVSELNQGIEYLFKKNKIKLFKGYGKIKQNSQLEASASSHQESLVVEIKTEDGAVLRLKTNNILCATGSVPMELAFLPFDEKQILSSTGALSLSSVPKSMIVIGGGAIGLELGSVWMRLGCQVTLIEAMDRIASSMDEQAVKVLENSLSKRGMKFLTQTQISGAERFEKSVKLYYEDTKTKKSGEIEAEVVLVAIGRKAFSEGLGLEELGVEKDSRGRVLVDAHYQTNVPGIYAIGDLIPGPMLAHRAEEEGVALAELLHAHMHAHKRQVGPTKSIKPSPFESSFFAHVNYKTLPSIIYTHPEIASVGLTEEEAKEKSIAYRVGQFPFASNGRAKALGFTKGFVKIISDAYSDKIIGAHIVGPRASELIGEIIIAMEFGGSSEDLARSFHAHPTLNEAIREAALAVDKRSRQM